MSDSPLYTASVPVFQRYLGRLGGWLDQAEAHTTPAVLGARLAPDMLPFETQAVIAANFALRAAYPLAGLPLPPFGDWAAGHDGLRARLAHVLALLDSLTPAQFAQAESRQVVSDAGEAMLQLDGATFLHQFALPNFFFHLTAAYAILRQQGVPLGKADFDGFHRYTATV